jgi:branched-chain amino acid transport system ATP-binding protein
MNAMGENQVGESEESGAAETPMLEVRALRRSFGGVQAVADATFAVPRGELFGLVGPNGAGKSTVMNLIAGSARPDAGEVLFEGRNLSGLSDYQRARAGLVRVFQHSTEFGRMTVLENLLVASPTMSAQTYRALLWTRRRSWERQEAEAVEEGLALLSRVGLRSLANDYAGTLSGGQKRLLELLRAVMAKPKLLLLDEPFAGVHARNTEIVCVLLEELHGEGVTILMTEHELRLVRRLCRQAIVMARGRVLFIGEPGEGLSRQEVIEAYVSA